MKNADSIPIACNLTPTALEDRKLALAALSGRAQLVTEVDDGFELIYAAETGLGEALLAVVAFERVCCPFLTFELSFPAGTDAIHFTIRGPDGTKAFLRSDLPTVFQ